MKKITKILLMADLVYIVWAYGKAQYYRGESAAYRKCSNMLENMTNELKEKYPELKDL